MELDLRKPIRYRNTKFPAKVVEVKSRKSYVVQFSNGNVKEYEEDEIDDALENIPEPRSWAFGLLRIEPVVSGIRVMVGQKKQMMGRHGIIALRDYLDKLLAEWE